MSDNSENNKRIAKNTLLLSVRMFFNIIISLFTSRLILETLGVEDFGIYNVVGGVVGMFTLVSGSLSAAISRYMTFELGKNDIDKLKKVFSTALNIQIVLSIIIIALAETIGLWYLNARMNISAERIVAANWVFQCSLVSFVLGLVSLPYNAAISAHEKMDAFAYISILETLLKLVAVYLLYITGSDKLIIWSVLILLISVIMRLVYGIYCKRKFEECTYKPVIDMSLFKEMSKFAGWNFIGVSSSIFRDQGVNILLNLFFGAAINAARGISFQICAVLTGFVGNLHAAINPQITKSYASDRRQYMMTLIFQASRMSFYLLLLLALPVFFETNFVLNLWLKNVPDHTVLFTRLVLIFMLTESISSPLITAMLATGDIKRYQIVVGGLMMLNFPVSYVLLHYGFGPEITLVVATLLSLACLAARMIMLRNMIDFKIRAFTGKVLVNIASVTALSLPVPTTLYYNMDEGFMRLIFICFFSSIWTLLIFYYVGSNKEERAFINSKITAAYHKFAKTQE